MARFDRLQSLGLLRGPLAAATVGVAAAGLVPGSMEIKPLAVQNTGGS